MECESMLFVKNHIPYLWDLSNSFSNSFIDFYSCEGFHQVIYQKEWSIKVIKLRVENGGWHETLNLFHVSRCEMLHFVTSYMKQNKSRKQTPESAQYGLEISFKGRTFSEVIRKSLCKLCANVNWRLIGLTVVLAKQLSAVPKEIIRSPKEVWLLKRV